MHKGSSAWRQVLIIGVFAAVYLMVTVTVANSYYQLVLTLVLIWAVMGSSWNMLSGYSGLISFGHASFFGLGAYTVTLAMVHWDITPWLGIPLGALVGMIAGVVIGLPTFRLRGHYFALAMLAYPLALLYVFEWLGYQEVPLPMKREHPALYMQFSDQRVYVMLALVLLVLALLVSLRIERSRFGMSLLAIKQNELAAEAAGIDTLRWKMYAIMLSGATAAAAGGLYAVVLLVVTPPTVFGMLTSAQALVVTLFGGVGTLWGSVIGACILIPLAETLHAELGHIIPGIQGVVFGTGIILVILLAPDGLYWSLRDWFTRRHRSVAARTPAMRTPVSEAASGLATSTPARVTPMAGGAPGIGRPLLQLVDVTKAFGGVLALHDVSLTAKEGQILGIIGPNGAGKTTLFNVINGFMPPDRGQIRLRDHDLLGRKPNAVCGLGIGRTFQVVRTFPRMTVLQNVVVGAYVGAANDVAAVDMARQALERVGMLAQADLIADGLTNIQLRLMELARALASRPQLLLLDETLAGLGHQETEPLLEVVRQLRDDGITIMIIEHTMQAMVRLVDRFVVLDHGRTIAAGEPDDVVNDHAVIEAYLGRKWVDRAGN
jgi:ABC-type branched-subunit amino acid transport system ATPase component/ABC-type branched-subunit amino acid transport system permease subunit